MIEAGSPPGTLEGKGSNANVSNELIFTSGLPVFEIVGPVEQPANRRVTTRGRILSFRLFLRNEIIGIVM